jgi:hypothetical protein
MKSPGKSPEPAAKLHRPCREATKECSPRRKLWVNPPKI